jgi:acetyltransferase-like isoleucine patch superfamily enzyme
MKKISAFYALFLVLINRLQGKKLVIGRRVRIHPFTCIDPDKGSITIGDGTTIHRGAFLKSYGGRISIGKKCNINPYCVLYGHGGLAIGDDVQIATQVVAIPADHIFAGRDKPISASGEVRRGITIGNDVWIGAGARILDGSDIATGCVIGANSVVKTKTEDYGVYVGTPARLLKSRI